MPFLAFSIFYIKLSPHQTVLLRSDRFLQNFSAVFSALSLVLDATATISISSIWRTPSSSDPGSCRLPAAPEMQNLVESAVSYWGSCPCTAPEMQILVESAVSYWGSCPCTAPKMQNLVKSAVCYWGSCPCTTPEMQCFVEFAVCCRNARLCPDTDMQNLVKTPIDSGYRGSDAY